jgi:D-alanyl-D-alanine carboxypeptidase (penicillin-binding protein 5/6)
MRRPSIRSGGFVLATLLSLAVILQQLGPRPDPAWATSTPPPTPVPPNGSPSPFPTVLTTPRPSLTPPPLGARSAILEDLGTGQVLFAKAPDGSRPIASLTKVMTALVVLSRTKPGDTVVVDWTAASQSGSVLGLRVGERITVRELLFALLVQSSNDAAVALAEHVGRTVPGFVAMMNRQAARMKLSHSRFTGPSGLDNGGLSSARDLATVARAAYQSTLFEQIVRTRFHDVPAPFAPPRHIQNRNVLLWLYPGAIGVKTGFTTPAGHCLIAAADRGGTRLVAVVLGATGPEDGGVFNDGAALLNYGFAAFAERTLIHVGDPVGPVTVEGMAVAVVAGATLLRLVRNDQAEKTTISFSPDRSLRLPITAGDRVGRVVVEVAGRRAGVVPAIASATVTGPPPQPPPPDPSRPATPLERGLRALSLLIQAVLGPFL